MNPFQEEGPRRETIRGGELQGRFSLGQANSPVLNYRLRFFRSCLFRFISIVPHMALSEIIMIISLLYPSGEVMAIRTVVGGPHKGRQGQRREVEHLLEG